jgi:hypothetical protein
MRAGSARPAAGGAGDAARRGVARPMGDALRADVARLEAKIGALDGKLDVRFAALEATFDALARPAGRSTPRTTVSSAGSAGRCARPARARAPWAASSAPSDPSRPSGPDARRSAPRTGAAADGARPQGSRMKV